jgi:hypothetical protein
MARNPINHGTLAGDGTGESLFGSFQKVNANEAELYMRAAGRQPRIAVCGGSIANRASYANTPNQGFSPANWLEWWQALAGQPFQVVAMAGEGGRQVSVVDANFQAEVGAHAPDIVVLGSDSIGNWMYADGARTAAEAMAYVESIYNKCAALEAQLVVFMLPPNNNLSAANDASFSKTYRTHEYNRLLLAFASTHHGMLAVPFHAHTDLAAVDSRYVTTTLAALQATEWTHDGTHPHPKLAIRLAQLMHAAFTASYPKQIMLPHAANADSLKCLANPLNYGTGGTNGAGNSNTLSGATATEEARTDIGDGGAWKNVAAAGAPASIVYTFGGAGAVPANMTPGATPIRALVELKLNATPINLRGFKLTLSFAGSATTIGGFSTSETGSFAQLADAGPFIPVGETLWLATAIDELPAGVTNFSLAIEAVKASAGNMTVDFSVGRAIVEPIGSAVPAVAFAQTTP